MTGGEVLSLGAIAVSGTICALVLRRQTPELSLTLSLVTVCILLWHSRRAFGSVLDLFGQLAQLSGLSLELLTPLVRTVGIALITRLGSQISRDDGMGSVAAFLELAGSAAALVTVIPLLQAVLELMEGLLL